MKHKLRPYQEQALDEILDNFKKGKRKVLLHMATGGGKTTVFSEIIKRTVARNKKAIMLVKGRKLVKQASDRLFREDVYHGVLMANHYLYRPDAPVQICSIDTIRSRRLRPDADIVIIDEVHDAISPTYKEVINQYHDAFILGVTATPYTKTPLSHVAQTVVHPVSVDDLIGQGFLIPPKYYSIYEPNLSKVRTQKGDFLSSDLEEILNKKTIVGNLVGNWKKYGQEKPTLCFAISVKHSQEIVEQFRRAGIRASHMDANTPDDERETIIKDLEDGHIKIISNVGILGTGVDIPCLGTIILARPTKSYNLYIQQCGRGTRPFGALEYFNILDHAGNVLRHGFIQEEPEPNLKDSNEFIKKNPRTYKTCLGCYCVYVGTKCPDCGLEKISSTNMMDKFEFINGELVEVKNRAFKMLEMAKQRLIVLEFLANKKGFKKAWIYHKLAQEFNSQIANDLVPKWFL